MFVNFFLLPVTCYIWVILKHLLTYIYTTWYSLQGCSCMNAKHVHFFMRKERGGERITVELVFQLQFFTKQAFLWWKTEWLKLHSMWCISFSVPRWLRSVFLTWCCRGTVEDIDGWLPSLPSSRSLLFVE